MSYQKYWPWVGSSAHRLRCGGRGKRRSRCFPSSPEHTAPGCLFDRGCEHGRPRRPSYQRSGTYWPLHVVQRRTSTRQQQSQGGCLGSSWHVDLDGMHQAARPHKHKYASHRSACPHLRLHTQCRYPGHHARCYGHLVPCSKRDEAGNGRNNQSVSVVKCSTSISAVQAVNCLGTNLSALSLK